jgi:hypothetical protein
MEKPGGQKINFPTEGVSGGADGRDLKIGEPHFRGASLRAACAARPLEPVLGVFRS